MFRWLGRLTTRHPWLTCLAWLTLAALVTTVAPNWRQHTFDDDIRFLPPHYAVSRGFDLLQKAFPQDVFACRVLLAFERANTPLTLHDFALVDEISDSLRELARNNPDLRITSLVSYREPMIGHRLTSADRHCTLIQISLATPYLALQTQATVDRIEQQTRTVVEKHGADTPSWYVTGPGAIGRDLVTATARSLDQTTWATVALVVLILLLVYRSPILALIPLTTIGVAAWVSVHVLALMTRLPGIHIVNISQVFTIVILFGAGTDYCLFLISRYREELGSGTTGEWGIVRSVEQVGGALAASAGTVIVGLGMMFWADFGKIRHAGPVIAVALVIGLAASLTLTPALLRLVGSVAFWPWRVHSSRARPEANNLWDRISRMVVRRPLTIWTLALLLLVPLALLGSQVAPTFKPTGDLGPKSPSVRGLEVIQRRFPAGETGPITVLLVSSSDFRTDDGKETIKSLSRGLGFLDNVAEVRSVTQPLGKPLPEIGQRPSSPACNRVTNALQQLRREMGDLVKRSLQRANDVYLSQYTEDGTVRYVARLDVVLRSDPFDPASIDTVGAIEAYLRSQLPPNYTWEIYGVPVHTRDMADLIAKDQRRVNLLVLTGVFAILLAVVRSLWLALYLLGTVLLSYWATLGATALFAMFGSGKPLGEIEWRVPFFLFTILIAVGEDYNILMVSRALQERRRHGPIEGLRRGLARTGGTITACGLIMAGTFATLMLGELWTLTQIGFALSVGVLIDTLIVRPFLVPAMMLVVWRDTQPFADHISPLHSSSPSRDCSPLGLSRQTKRETLRSSARTTLRDSLRRRFGR
jgi:RND superfamily putative drug exporter